MAHFTTGAQKRTNIFGSTNADKLQTKHIQAEIFPLKWIIKMVKVGNFIMRTNHEWELVLIIVQDEGQILS